MGFLRDGALITAGAVLFWKYTLLLEYFWYLVLIGVGAFILPMAIDNVPSISVTTSEEECENVLTDKKKFDPAKMADMPKDKVYCWDPSTLDDLGTMPVTSEKDVVKRINSAKKAQVRASTTRLHGAQKQPHAHAT
jgi:hypothetical protein